MLAVPGPTLIVLAATLAALDPTRIALAAMLVARALAADVLKRARADAGRVRIARGATLATVAPAADALRPVWADVGRVRAMATTLALTRVARARAPGVMVPIRGAPDRARIVRAVTLVAQGRLAIDRVLIRVAAIPTLPGPPAAGRDGRRLAVDGPGRAQGVAGRVLRVHIEPVKIVVRAMVAPFVVAVLAEVRAEIAQAHLVAARPPIRDL